MGYSLKNMLKQEPAAITAVIMGWVAVLVITGAISWSVETVAAVNAALLATLLLLWVRPATVSRDAMRQLDAAINPPPPPEG